MRKLILRRKSSTIASLIRVSVYATDPSGDVTIDRLPCRKLGTIKNTGLETFSIPEEETMIFVLASEPNDQTAYPFQTIPAGQKDVLLSVKMKPRKNHPTEKFIASFDSNARFDPQKIQNRSNFGKWLVRMLVILFITVACRGCLAQMDAPCSFTKEEFSITLTNSFEENEAEDSFACYTSGNATVFVNKIEPQDPDQTAEQYATNWLLINKEYSLITKNEDGSIRFHFDKTNDAGDRLRYTFYFYRTSDAIWAVQFITKTEDLTELDDQIKVWAESVAFSNE